MDHDLTPAQLTPSEAMQAKLTLQKQAAIAVIEADNDARLRRALLRQHQAIQYVYHTGQRVFYWRDAPGGAGPKLRWKGPATVVMTEEGRTGPATNTYWVTHGTTLLRVSGEHLRPDLNHQDDTDPIIRAKNALDQIRGRSTTLYTDLQKTNKRKRSEVVTEDEDDTEMTPALPETTTATAPEQPQDHWDVEEDGITWHRIHVVPRQALYVPSGDSQAPHEHFQDLRRTTILRPGQPQKNRTVLQDDWRLPDASRSMPFSWTGTTTFILRTDRGAPPGDDDVQMEQQPTAPLPPTAGTEEHDNSPEPTTGSTTTGIMTPAMPPGDPPAAAPAEHTGPPPSSSGEPEPPPSVLGDATYDEQVTIPEHQQAVYNTPERQESFQERRSRYDKQETLSFYAPTDNRVRYGPNKEPFETLRTSPYSKPKAPDPEEALTMSTYDADLTKADNMTLPPGWKLENGYLTLDECRDEWTLYGDKLVRRHYIPRNKLFDPISKGANCPLPTHYLSKDRQTLGTGNINKYDKYDRWKQKKDEDTTYSWTGRTVFKVLPAFRLLAKEAFYNASQGHQTYIEPPTEQAEHSYTAAATGKTRKDQLNERQMTVADRLAFMEAKKKELESFFQNDVWEMIHDDGSTPQDRILKAHFILKWTKWPNGEPRAKARLITQGFKDPDALSGQLSTDSPTLSRIGRNYILSICANTGWSNFSADVSAAFLQGKEHPSHRTLWIKLPPDARRLLGINDKDGDKALMRLKKPMYGLCDAPRAWYSEARERITKLGAIVHPLDPCLFMAYDYDAPEDTWTTQADDNGNNVKHPPLIGLFGLHVDDVLGCGNMHNKNFQAFLKSLKQTFNFRTWAQDTDMDYCGATIHRVNEHHHELHHSKYLKPISFEDGPDTQPVTDKQRTMLRGTIGALQWPATQSSPHLQAMVSQLAGQVSKATLATLREANKCLRYAKSYSDVGLKYQKLGPTSELTLIGYSDAAFASRSDLTSQGGQLILMVHKDVTNGAEGSYHLIDWRSWKLPRVARSSLAAESQAASETADSLLYAAAFWKLIWSPYLALQDSNMAKLQHPPKMVIDAKALYDLLVKQDLQTGSQTDKQTSIEVLVTKDKLSCTGASIAWVSSELQFADGMTKHSAAALLAQRLRSHITCRRPDPNFTAAKKKTVEQRKSSQMRYAVTKPTAQLALLASLATTTTAHSTNLTEPPTDNMDYQNFTFLAVFTVMVALLVNMALNYFTNRQVRTRHLKDATSQTSYSDLTTLVNHRKKEQQLEKTWTASKSSSNKPSEPTELCRPIMKKK